MKHLRTLMVCSLIIFSMTSFVKQDEFEVYKNKLQNKSNLLKEYFIKSQSKDSLINMTTFFNEFPDNFVDLKVIYGYSENGESLGILYFEAENHINLFFNTNRHINNETFVKKTIMTALNGKWQSDGIYYFQTGLRKTITNNLDSYCRLLNKFTDREIISFWFFVFDEPYPSAIPREWNLTKSISPRIYNLMLKGDQKAIDFRKK